MINLMGIEPNVVQRSLEGKHFMLFGPPGTRKTSIAAKFKDCLILGTEVGYKLIPGVMAQPIKSWIDFREVIRQLDQQQIRDRFSTIAIDTFGILYEMCYQYHLEKHGVTDPSEVPYGKVWKELKQEFKDKVNKIPQMGYSVVFIAHSLPEREEEGTGRTLIEPDLDKRAKSLATSLVDFSLYLRKEPLDGIDNPTDNDMTVYAYSKVMGSENSKSRARHLAPRFEFNWETLEKEVIAAIDKLEDEGATITDVVTHIEEINEVPFKEMQEEAIRLAVALFELENTNPAAYNKATSVVSESLKGVRLSETTDIHRPQVEIIVEELKAIAAGCGIS